MLTYTYYSQNHASIIILKIMSNNCGTFHMRKACGLLLYKFIHDDSFYYNILISPTACSLGGQAIAKIHLNSCIHARKKALINVYYRARARKH